MQRPGSIIQIDLERKKSVEKIKKTLLYIYGLYNTCVRTYGNGKIIFMRIYLLATIIILYDACTYLPTYNNNKKIIYIKYTVRRVYILPWLHLYCTWQADRPPAPTACQMSVTDNETPLRRLHTTWEYGLMLEISPLIVCQSDIQDKGDVRWC